MPTENAIKSITKIAFITGAGRGLGRKAVALQLDSSDVSTFDSFVRDFAVALRSKWGRDRFDFLVNNAGTTVYAPFAQTQEADLDLGGGSVRDNPEINKQIASITALGRAGVPDDIGPMIASLLSDDNRWITAQRIEVSGGMFLQRHPLTRGRRRRRALLSQQLVAAPLGAPETQPGAVDQHFRRVGCRYDFGICPLRARQVHYRFTPLEIVPLRQIARVRFHHAHPTSSAINQTIAALA
jgi:Enoyl-(Acyl carrier protein) reductase